MINRIKDYILENRLTAALVAVIIVILVGGGIVFAQITSQRNEDLPIEEVELPFDPEGPYAILQPRRDGNALVLNIKRVSAYKAISYELAYQSEGVDRGVTGALNTNEKKNEYTQEILFGTCSQGFTSGTAHCVFDKEVENGTLTLKIEKGPEPGAKVRRVYKMITTWHMQKPDVALGVITSGDAHFTYKTDADTQTLTVTGFTIINDLSGSPKLPQGKQILGKVYAFNVPPAKSFPNGQVSIELAENPPADAKIARFIEKNNDWEILDTKINKSTLTANVQGEGIFTVFASQTSTP